MARADPVRFDRRDVPRGRLEHTDRVQSLRVDAVQLAAALTGRIEGEVRFDDSARALYATDASNYRQVPIGIVLPRTKQDVVAAVATAREFRVPVLMRGGGTSLAGQCCNVAVVLDTSKYMNAVVQIDAERRFARVLPGTVLDDLRNAAEQFGLTFGPDPATHTHCTLGGMIGNNSCGVHSVMAGRTSDNVEELEILTYDGARFRVGATSEAEIASIIGAGGRRGEIYARLLALRDQYAETIRKRFPKIPRRVSGFALDELLPENGFHVARALCGSECTCAIVLEARVQLVPSPRSRALVVLGYPDVYTAADRIPDILAFRPIGLEGMDHRLTDDMRRKGLGAAGLRLLPEGRGWLLVEFGGETEEEARAGAQTMVDALGRKRPSPAMAIFTDPRETALVWRIREAGLGATANVPDRPLTWEDGKTQRSRRSASATICAISAICWTSTDTTATSTDTSARGAFTRASTSISRVRAASPPFASSSSVRPISSCRTAARCPVSTAMGSLAASCWNGCTVPSSSRRLANSSVYGIPCDG